MFALTRDVARHHAKCEKDRYQRRSQHKQDDP
jgi:hypothetical protein